MKRILCVALIMLVSIVSFGASTGLLADDLWGGLIKTDGTPNAGGFVYVYEAGTTTAKTIWTDVGKTTPASQPITLDPLDRDWET